LYLISRELGTQLDKVSVELVTPVNLTAPATAGTLSFQKWQKDGVDYSASPSTSVGMGDGDHTLTAVYGTSAGTRTLSVTSSNPASGLSITVSPTDSNGAGTGVTPFNRVYNAAFIWEAEQAARSGPFYAAANGGTGFVVQDLGTGPNDGGVLTIPFN